MGKPEPTARERIRSQRATWQWHRQYRELVAQLKVEGKWKGATDA